MGTEEFYEFKRLYKEFIKTINYINSQYDKLINEPEKLNRYKINLKKKYEEPMDEAWNKLTQEEKEKYLSVYTHTKQKELF